MLSDGMCLKPAPPKISSSFGALWIFGEALGFLEDLVTVLLAGFAAPDLTVAVFVVDLIGDVG